MIVEIAIIGWLAAGVLGYGFALGKASYEEPYDHHWHLLLVVLFGPLAIVAALLYTKFNGDGYFHWRLRPRSKERRARIRDNHNQFLR